MVKGTFLHFNLSLLPYRGLLYVVKPITASIGNALCHFVRSIIRTRFSYISYFYYTGVVTQYYVVVLCIVVQSQYSHTTIYLTMTIQLAKPQIVYSLHCLWPDLASVITGCKTTSMITLQLCYTTLCYLFCLLRCVFHMIEHHINLLQQYSLKWQLASEGALFLVREYISSKLQLHMLQLIHITFGILKIAQTYSQLLCIFIQQWVVVIIGFLFQRFHNFYLYNTLQ